MSEKKRRNLESDGGALILIYHGSISNGRGIEDIISAVEGITNVGVILLGVVSDKEYQGSLLTRLNSSSMKRRIVLHKAVPMEELCTYLGTADIGVCTIFPIGKSYYYALPNKLFENIQAANPVTVSSLPKMKKL